VASINHRSLWDGRPDDGQGQEISFSRSDQARYSSGREAGAEVRRDPGARPPRCGASSTLKLGQIELTMRSHLPACPVRGMRRSVANRTPEAAFAEFMISSARSSWADASAARGPDDFVQQQSFR